MSTNITVKAGNKYLAKQHMSFDGTRKWDSPLEPTIWYCVKETETCWHMSHINPRVYNISENDGHFVEKSRLQSIFEFIEDLGDYNKTN